MMRSYTYTVINKLLRKQRACDPNKGLKNYDMLLRGCFVWLHNSNKICKRPNRYLSFTLTSQFYVYPYLENDLRDCFYV